MAQKPLTQQDLQRFRCELLQALQQLLQPALYNQSLVLRSNQVRRLLHVSASTLQKLRRNGTLPYVKVGGMYFYRPADLERLVQGKGKEAKR